MPVLREAGVADAGRLALVGGATFLETYAHMIPGDDLLAHCAGRHSAAAYGALLSDGARAWLVETAVGAPVGYGVLTGATLPAGGPDPRDREVLRIYVLSRFHGDGTGRLLMDAMVGAARATGAPRVVLGTHKGNTRALAFYARCGFGQIGERRFQVGASVFEDWVLGLSLQ